ncbi:MAG: hypothetical protein Q9M19_01260 [Mariprofundaceae bacterium]|nr:hypothetical protein [Mariprofundaceae bacterium]
MSEEYERGYTCSEEVCLTRLHLETALLALVRHDVEKANRDGLPVSFELQEAIDVLTKHVGYNEVYFGLKIGVKT